MPLDLTDEQWIDLTGDPARLHGGSRKGLKRAGLDPSSFPFEPGRRPYPGFAFLEEKDAAIFFGRDAQIVRGLDEIRSLVRTGVTACWSSWARLVRASRPSCAPDFGRA